MATYKQPTPIIEFAPAATTTSTPFSPWNQPTSGDWVALTFTDAGKTKTRLESYSMKRGKSDKEDAFDPGAATFVLNNQDGQLDEFKTGSLTEGNKGGPLTPIRLKATNAYTGTTSILWTGYITAGWEPSESSTRVRTVTVRAIDWMGWASSKEMPGSQISAAIARNFPFAWWRGRLTSHRITSTTGGPLGGVPGYAYDGFTSKDDVSHVVGSPITSAAAEQAGSIIPAEKRLPAIRLQNGCRLISYAPMSTGLTRWGFACVFQVRDTSTYGRDLVVARTSSSPTSNRRWRVRIGTNGDVAVEMFTAAGASLGVTTISEAHNDGQPHMVVAEFSLTSATVTTDLGSATAPPFGTPAGSGGWLFTGNDANDVRVLIQEWAAFNGGPTAYLDDPVALLDNKATVLETDDITDRVAHLEDFAELTLPLGFWNPYVTPGGTQVGSYVPRDNLAAAVQAAGQGLAGGAFATREGGVQVYGYGDMSDAYFATSSVLFSNQAGATGVIRYSGSGRTGRRIDRIINEVRGSDGALLARDQASIDTWGLQSIDIDSMNTSSTRTYAASLVAARKDPSADLGELTIEHRDQTATTWLFEECELGRRVAYLEYSPDGASVVYFVGLNVQSEEWSWSNGIGDSASDWTVTLKLA